MTTMTRNYGLLAALSALFVGGPNVKRPTLTRAELKELRRSGNRTAPAHIQAGLIKRAAEKRARKNARRLAGA